MRALPNQSRFSTIEQICQSINCDIWFLTETHEALIPSRGYFSHFSGIPDRDSDPGERWSAIWSKWPIEPLDSYATDLSRSVSGRISESAFGEIILYGTVLPWNTDPRAKNLGSFAAFAHAVEIQKSDWLKIQRDFPKATLIVAGDFNQSLVDRHYYGSKKKRVILEKILKECELSPLTSGKNDPIARDSYPRACIDHICIASKENWGVEKTSRWPDNPNPDLSLTDHFRVMLDLRI